MDQRHHCTMTQRHLIARKAVTPRWTHHSAQRRFPGNLKTPLLHRSSACHQRARQLSSASRRANCRAVESPEVSAEPDKSSTTSTGGSETAERFGIATRQLNELADSAPQDVYNSQSAVVSSAAQLAHLLGSSLKAGISESSALMADRGSRLGRNNLPERNQVPGPCLTALQTPLQAAHTSNALYHQNWTYGHVRNRLCPLLVYERILCGDRSPLYSACARMQPNMET